MALNYQNPYLNSTKNSSLYNTQYNYSAPSSQTSATSNPQTSIPKANPNSTTNSPAAVYSKSQNYTLLTYNAQGTTNPPTVGYSTTSSVSTLSVGTTPPTAGSGSTTKVGTTPPVVGGGSTSGVGTTPPTSGGGTSGVGTNPPTSGGSTSGVGTTPPTSGGGTSGVSTTPPPPIIAPTTTPPTSGGGTGTVGNTSGSTSFSTGDLTEAEQSEALYALLDLGYIKSNIVSTGIGMTPSVIGMMSASQNWNAGITQYQHEHGLKETGTLDTDTYLSIMGISTKSVYAYEYKLSTKINKIDSSFDNQVKSCNDNYLKNKALYDRLSEKTGVPSALIAAIHFRESGCDFTKSIRDGSSLPQGKTFEEDAITVLTEQKKSYDNCSDDHDRLSYDRISMLTFAERWNGLAYKNHGRVSPYVYSGTNLYTTGKYISDNVYKSTEVDAQAGVYILLKGMLG